MKLEMDFVCHLYTSRPIWVVIPNSVHSLSRRHRTLCPPPPLIIRQKTILRRGARQSHQMRRSHVLRCHCSRRGRVNDDGVVPAQGTRSDTRRRRFRRLMRRRRQRRARRRSRFGRYRRPSACVLSRADKAVSYPCQRGDSQFLSRQPII